MNSFGPILPELILTVGGIVLMMVAAFLGRRGSTFCTWSAIVLLIVAAAVGGEDVARQAQ